MLSAFLGVVMLPDSAFALLLHEVKQDSGNGTFLRETSRSLAAKEGCQMNLMELLTLLTFILSLLSLLVDVIRLTLEVIEKTLQRKTDKIKKD